jgi:Tol biopolymer transport system component
VRVALALVLAALMAVPTATARPGAKGLRILYASDWTGPMEIFAADPSGRAPIQQVTFARPDGVCQQGRPAEACGYTRPQPSPDGRWLAYWSVGSGYNPAALWLARADGTSARTIGVGYDADWSPDSRSLAYSAADGIHVATTAGADRIVYRTGTYVSQAHWSPDGKAIAFAGQGGLIVLRGGRSSVLVPDEPDSIAWSPDSREIAYATNHGIFLVSTSPRSHVPRPVYIVTTQSYYPTKWDLAFSPNGRVLAFHDAAKIGLVDSRTLRMRTFAVVARDIAWAPDGSRLLVVRGTEYDTAISTGDLQTLTPSGHVAGVVSASGAYGGQIDSAAWTVPARGIAYRLPQRVTGVFAGGPVQELVADGERVALVECATISTAVPTSGEIDVAATLSSVCPARSGRQAYVASLALAGDRLVWWEADLGLGYGWSMRELTLGGTPIEIAHGSGTLGGPPNIGSGTAVGAGSLLAISNWRHHYENGHPLVDRQAIQRVEPGGCPCTEISSSPGLYTPLDVDENRIVVSGTNETRILAPDGTILLSVRVPTLAAQLSGSQLVLAVGNTLRVYDADSGALDATWPLPTGPAGHDCNTYGDPSCTGSPRPPVTLEDVAHGLAAYILNGQVHVLRLSDGVDRLVAPGTLARFVDGGLVYADGARIWLTAYDQLPLQ